LEIAEEVMQKIRARRKLEKTGDARCPWPGYNGGKQFRCNLCGAHFDTSSGIARHQVYGCDAPKATPPAPKTLPRCRACGSYALYREQDGTLTCETCRMCAN
jgi:hypothetical protein